MYLHFYTTLFFHFQTYHILLQQLFQSPTLLPSYNVWIIFFILLSTPINTPKYLYFITSSSPSRLTFTSLFTFWPLLTASILLLSTLIFRFVQSHPLQNWSTNTESLAYTNRLISHLLPFSALSFISSPVPFSVTRFTTLSKKTVNSQGDITHSYFNSLWVHQLPWLV